MALRKPFSAVLLSCCLAIPATAGPAGDPHQSIIVLQPGTSATHFVERYRLSGARPLDRLGIVLCPTSIRHDSALGRAVRDVEPDPALTLCQRARATPATARLGLPVAGPATAKAPIGILDGGIQPRDDLRIVYRLGNESRPTAESHGTALAMLAAGPTGAAPGAPIWDLAAWPATETPKVSHALLMIDQLLDHPRRPAVILCAWTAPRWSGALATAIRRLTQAGSLVVAAAGNDGMRVEGVLPAALPEVLSVSAYDNASGLQRDDRGYASWSNWGPTVDLTAPGVALYTWTGTQWGSIDGTSGAAALVAGLAGRIAATPGTPASWQARLLRAAQPPSGPKDRRHGEPMAMWPPDRP